MSVFIGGIYNLQDIKYDILKIIEPYDGDMYNQTDTDRVTHLFNSFLGDLRQARKIYEYEVTTIDKDNAVTFDVVVKLHRDRSPKKLKIHVGRLVHFRDIQAA
jgi:hypothetical protein